jgi:glycine oxidase
MSDCLIVGGGVIGLSLAYELAGRAVQVRVIDAGQPGRESSWAGAGILPPVGAHDPAAISQLTALSNRLHAAWHQQLLSDTGIDNGYRRSGGIYLAREAAGEQALRLAAAGWQCDAIRFDQLESFAALAEIEPGLRPEGPLRAAYYLPDECQIRNPRHVKALIAACLGRGVEISSDLAAEDFVVRGARVEAVRTRDGLLSANRFCLTSGAWTSALLARIAAPPPIRPVRGQIALVSLPAPPLSRVVNEGLRYLVPRDDGRVLIGSTEDDVGFDRSTTTDAIAELQRFGGSLCPALAQGVLERSWAGLRPASADGLPYLGSISGFENAFLAAGHFRSGLQLSAGTAVVMADLICAQPASIDLAAFRIDRHAAN